MVTAGPAQLYDDNLRQLLNARNLLLAVWAAWVWRTSTSPQWRKMLGVYAAGLALTFVAGIGSDVVDGSNQYAAGGLWDLLRMAPYVVMALAAGIAFDEKLFEPADEAPRHTGLPVVSMIAITLLVAIPAVDEVARRLFAVSPATELLRTRLALAMMIPCGAVVVAREFLSRRALVRASQDLVAAREQLVQKEKLAAVGQLVSGVAHELNNPLQGVLGYAELMLAARPAAPAAEELRAIRDNANRAASIVRNLLTFAGRTSSARGWQQMNRVVRDAVATREPQLRSQDIEIRVELAERLPLVYIDHARLEDVLVNLIQNSENAIAARQAGDRISSLVPANARGEITLTTSVRGDPDRILVEVFDNGSGLKGEDLNRVFDPFFTTREVGQGTGLGLSVCYGIVREHGGQITARNAAGGGAAFTIELPVMAESLATVAAAGAGAPPMASEVNAPSEERVNVPPRRPKALVVLSRRALVMIERTAYDAVIADVKMPELSGQELYGRVCQIRPEMARRFIFITGDIDGEETREFLDQSRCSYFMKPFNLERLTSAVDTLTGSRAPDNVG